MIEILSVIIKYFIIFFNAIMIAKYYSVFLVAKNEKIPIGYIQIGFGSGFFLLQSLIDYILSGLPIHVDLSVGTILLCVTTFILSLLFFEYKIKMLFFLLCSFFAIREIGLLISFSIFSLTLNMNTPFMNFLTQLGILTTSENQIAFVDIFSFISFIVFTLLYVSILFLSLMHNNKRYLYKNHMVSFPELLYLLLPCFSGFFISIIIKAILYKPDGNGITMLFKETPFIGLLIPLLGLILLFSLLASVTFFHKSVKSYIEEKEKAVLHKQIRHFEEQRQDIDDIYVEIRGMQHDMKSHLTNIQLLLKSAMMGNQNSRNEIENYIDKLGVTLNKLEFTYQTGNSTTDVIIHQKYLEATKHGVHFSADFAYPLNLNINSYNLAVILNNSLENAIEACMQVPEPERFIQIYAYTKGNMFFIEVENSFLNDIHFNKHTGLPVSTKSNHTTHGMGLSNIQRCARNYLGDINIQISKKENHVRTFRLIIMLQGNIRGKIASHT